MPAPLCRGRPWLALLLGGLLNAGALATELGGPPRSPELNPLRHFSGVDLDRQRQAYRAALASLYGNNLPRFERQQAALETYPLAPYLAYYRLLRYLSRASEADVLAFRDRYGDSRLGDRLMTHWLENLARRKQWSLYARHYDPALAPGTAPACHGAWAQLQTARSGAEAADAVAAATTLWLAPRSQPKACDPLFDALIDGGHITAGLGWERFMLALEAQRPALARYVLRFLDPPRLALGETLLARTSWATRAHTLAAQEAAAPTAGARADALTFALRKWAGQDREGAEAALEAWRDQLPNSSQASIRMALLDEQLEGDDMARLTQLPWPPAELKGESTADLVERFAEKALGDGAWEALLVWLERMPPWMQGRARWQYWRAHSELALGLGEVAVPLGPEPVPSPAAPPLLSAHPRSLPLPLTLAPGARLAALARDRSYYGFLAADRLSQPYQLAEQRPAYRFEIFERVAQEPAVRRAFELRALGERPEARLELLDATRRLNREETLHLAALADQAGWHRMAIAATIQGEHWDVLDLRFPLAFEGPLRAQAEATALPSSWLFAITRQESAFMSDARSRVGALGLMQLMPSTARLVAKDLGLDLNSRWAILEEETNLTLGSHYLKRLSDRFAGHRVLASAAYNAGPHRVSQWHQRFGGSSAAEWIERIPFDETRRYVQNVLAYAVIYGDRLGEGTPLFRPQERLVPAPP
jgi:soluble lytic murein transglycosylase